MISWYDEFASLNHWIISFSCKILLVSILLITRVFDVQTHLDKHLIIRYQTYACIVQNPLCFRSFLYFLYLHDNRATRYRRNAIRIDMEYRGVGTSSRFLRLVAAISLSLRTLCWSIFFCSNLFLHEVYIEQKNTVKCNNTCRIYLTTNVVIDILSPAFISTKETSKMEMWMEWNSIVFAKKKILNRSSQNNSPREARNEYFYRLTRSRFHQKQNQPQLIPTGESIQPWRPDRTW